MYLLTYHRAARSLSTAKVRSGIPLRHLNFLQQETNVRIQADTVSTGTSQPATRRIVAAMEQALGPVEEVNQRALICTNM